MLSGSPFPRNNECPSIFVSVNVMGIMVALATLSLVLLRYVNLFVLGLR